MCGITGFWTRENRFESGKLEQICQQMTSALSHRGPDGAGNWHDIDSRIYLGHRRLSILDLSELGKQPMTSACGRYVMVYNGEVYNHLEIRRELENKGHTFRGHSDTETMLAAFVEWGVIPSITRFNGMFACAIWDYRDHKLILFRDRMGIKPLYYGVSGKTLVFGSELKSLRIFPDFNKAVNRDALALMLSFGYVPAPYSIYESINKLPAGSYLEIEERHIFQAGVDLPLPVYYWDINQIVNEGLAHQHVKSENELLEELDALLTSAVKYRLLSDVAVGAFLSGGIDSSLVVSLMQKVSAGPVKSFSIGFSEEKYNEAHYAKAVAKHLGTDHTELTVSPADAMGVIPMLPQMYDEPFGDVSQIPTYLVSKLAREQVVVSLSGDGGDELFCGYNRYFHTADVWKKMSRLPARSLIAAVLKLGQKLPSAFRMGKNFTHRIESMSVASVHELYRDLLTHYRVDQLVKGVKGSHHLLWDTKQWEKISRPQERWMWLDAKTYLADDILVKVDRASMAVGLEARVPLIDYRVVQWAWQLPFEYKVQNQSGKYLLKQLLNKYVPRELIDRPKMGFGVPIDTWLKGPLKSWGEKLLQPDKLKQEGYLNVNLVTQRWEEHQSGVNRWHYSLWNILMFEAWLEQEGRE